MTGKILASLYISEYGMSFFFLSCVLVYLFLVREKADWMELVMMRFEDVMKLFPKRKL